MAGGDRENNPNHDDMTGVLFAGMLLAAGAAVWIWARAVIVVPALWIKWVQIKAWSATVGLGEEGTRYLQYIENVLSGRFDPWTIQGWIFLDLMTTVGGVVRFPMAALVLAIAAVVFLRMPGNQFKNRYTLKSFAAKQAGFFETLHTSVGFNPDDHHPNLRRGDFPSDWMRERGIPVSMIKSGAASQLDVDPRNKVAQAFVDQLGETWKGPENSPTHVRAIIAVIATHGAKRRDKSLGVSLDSVSLYLQNKLAVIYRFEKNPKERDAKVEKLIAPYIDDASIMEPFLEHANRHAYTTTALMKTLRWARKENGVLASNTLLWVKGIDRTLFYCLNQVGRMVSMIESAGPVSHYTFESQRRKPVLEPKIENAILGLEDYITRENIVESV